MTLNKIELIASLPNKSETRSWERKAVAMAKLLEQLQPIEEKMLEIVAQRQPLVDEIEELRTVMTQECIHPIEHLVEHGNHIECKFCMRRLVVTDD